MAQSMMMMSSLCYFREVSDKPNLIYIVQQRASPGQDQ
jgi:hypothetical protein